MDRITPSEYFNRYVMRAFEDFKKNSTDDYLGRIACMWAFHMHEVFFEEGSEKLKRQLGGSKGEYKKRVLNLVESFAVVETVCSVSKHVNTQHERTPASVENVQPQIDHILLEDGGKLLLESGGAVLLESSGTYLTVGDEKVNLIGALESVIAFWQRELEESAD